MTGGIEKLVDAEQATPEADKADSAQTSHSVIDLRYEELAPADAPQTVRTDARKVRIEGDPFGDLVEETNARRGRRLRLALQVAVLLIVLALVSVEFISLHSRVQKLHTTNLKQQQELANLQTQLSNLDNSYSATVTCLASGQAQKTLCLQFTR